MSTADAMTDTNPVANNDLTALLVAFDDCLRVLRHAPAGMTPSPQALGRGNFCLSTRRTHFPAAPSSAAATLPATDPPTTITSYFMLGDSSGLIVSFGGGFRGSYISEIVSCEKNLPGC